MRNPNTETANPAVPANPEVPLTLEGAAILHQVARIRWRDWNLLEAEQRLAIVSEAAGVLGAMEAEGSAAFSVLGHKGDLMLVHFRRGFDDLSAAERRLSGLRLSAYLEQTTSYLSVVELGLYESSVKLLDSLAERGVEPGSEPWVREVEETLDRQAKAMAPRLFPEVPAHRYICFYPMDRRRGEHKNWYRLPIRERQRMMAEHGLAGRKYAGVVKQIISGSIGLDDWEWGVDLFADDPVVFKKLIYEMRFDEVSAEYAVFGPFYVGIRTPAARLGALLAGEAPVD
jgi:chlorite dismutase